MKTNNIFVIVVLGTNFVGKVVHSGGPKSPVESTPLPQLFLRYQIITILHENIEHNMTNVEDIVLIVTRRNFA